MICTNGQIIGVKAKHDLTINHKVDMYVWRGNQLKVVWKTKPLQIRQMCKPFICIDTVIIHTWSKLM